MTDSDNVLKGSVAVITGAASGIGRALAEELGIRGCHVVLADIDGAEVEAVAAGIRERGGSATASRVDVTRFESVRELIYRTVDAKGGVDYLFNNAGIGVAGEAKDYTIESWERIVAVNLMGVVNGVQAAYPQMIRQGNGHIINTASMAGLITSAGLVSYSATKHAVVGLSKALRVEAEPLGVKVSVLCPGVIRTPLLRGGRHGIFVMPIPEAKQREASARLFESLRPLDVQVFARKVVDQVLRNRAIIVIPAWYRLFWWLERLSPALGAAFARLAFRRFQKISAG